MAFGGETHLEQVTREETEERELISYRGETHLEGPVETRQAVDDLDDRFKERGLTSNVKASWTLPRKESEIPRSMKRLLRDMKKELKLKIAETAPQSSHKCKLLSNFNSIHICSSTQHTYIAVKSLETYTTLGGLFELLRKSVRR